MEIVEDEVEGEVSDSCIFDIPETAGYANTVLLISFVPPFYKTKLRLIPNILLRTIRTIISIFS